MNAVQIAMRGGSNRRLMMAALAGLLLPAAGALAVDPPSWDLMDENYGSGPGEVSFNAQYTYMWGPAEPTETLVPGKALLTLEQGSTRYPTRTTLPGLPQGGGDVTTEFKLQTPITASVILYYSETNNASSAWDHIIMLNRQFNASAPVPNAIADYNRRDPNLNQAPAGYDGTAEHTYRIVRSQGQDSFYVDGELAFTPIVTGAGARQDAMNLEWGFYQDFAPSTYDLSISYFKIATGAYFPTPPPPSQWAANVSGSWNNVANWSGTAGVPNGVDAVARLWGNITEAQTVYTNSPIVLGTLSFDSANSYQLTGQGSLAMDVSTGNALIEVKQGDQKINLPLFLNDNTTADVAGGATLLIADPMTLAAGSTLNKAGAGDLVIEAPVRNAGAAAMVVSGGTARLNYPVGTAASASAAASAALDVSVTGSKLIFGADQVVRSLSAATANAGDQEIDLAGFKAQLYAADRAAAELSVYNAIKNAMQSASGKDGIYDSTIASSNYAVGVTDQAVDAHGDHLVVVKKTILGDTNVDGHVDVIDLGILATSWQTNGLWDNGDSNFDGFIDVIDLGMLATNWQQSASGPSLGEALAAYGLPSVSVPEPASIGLVGLFGGMILGRKRR